MPGNSDYMAEAATNFVSGAVPAPAIAGRWLALFTTAPTADAGTGGTEVSGGAYARVQVAGEVTATASWTTGVSTISIPGGNTWIVPGMNVWDTTNAVANGQIGTVLSYSGTTLTLTANASHASTGSADVIAVSAWPQASASTGTEPSVTPVNAVNGAAITFATATLSWGTVIFWGIYDAVTSGNFLFGDYLGNNKWIPFSCTNASPGVLTTDANADAPANGTSCVVTAKFGGTLPTTAGSWAGVLTSAGLSTNTFNLGVNTTSVGGGLFRQITQQSIPANVTASFAAATFTLTSA
jgi:hypothetical protein